jgi:transcriptional regulator NrdR family protein
MSVKCLKCESKELTVIDSRTRPLKAAIDANRPLVTKRRLKCKACGYKANTTELYDAQIDGLEKRIHNKIIKMMREL